MTEMEQFIRQYAASIGLNPDIVMRTVLSEGGRSSLEPAGYVRQSLVQGRGGQEQSYGPFQMYMGKGALGDRALQAGYDPRDPAQAFNVAKFAMDTMAKEGLGAWHGWKGSPWAAHGGQASGETVDVPTVVAGRYDPRSDTPSSARPTSEQIGDYATEHPVGPAGDVVTNTPYSLPAPGTAENPLVTKDASTTNPYAKIGAAVAKLGDRSSAPSLGPVTTPQNPGLSALPAMSSIDPTSSNNQRAALIQAMMRLNSGQLWPSQGGGIG